MINKKLLIESYFEVAAGRFNKCCVNFSIESLIPRRYLSSMADGRVEQAVFQVEKLMLDVGVKEGFYCYCCL